MNPRPSGLITAAPPTEVQGQTFSLTRVGSATRPYVANAFFYQPTWQRNIFLILIGGYVEFIVNPVDLIYRLFITELRFRKVRVTILLLIFTKLNIVAIQELLQFALLHFALKKLLHFALIILLHSALILLHFVLVLHFAA